MVFINHHIAVYIPAYTHTALTDGHRSIAKSRSSGTNDGHNSQFTSKPLSFTAQRLGKPCCHKPHSLEGPHKWDSAVHHQSYLGQGIRG
jgi:hypothetical protein